MKYISINEAKKILGGGKSCWGQMISDDGKGSCSWMTVCQNTNKYGGPTGNAYRTGEVTSGKCSVSGKPYGLLP